MFPFKSHQQVALDIQYILTNEGVADPDACLIWALGDDYSTQPVTLTDTVWNKRHGDLFLLCGTDLYIDGIRRIARAYIKKEKACK